MVGRGGRLTAGLGGLMGIFSCLECSRRTCIALATITNKCNPIFTTRPAKVTDSSKMADSNLNITLGHQLAGYLNQFINTTPTIEHYMTLVEGGEFHSDEAYLQISHENFAEITNQFVVEALRNGQSGVLSCMMTKDILERLGAWKPWLMFSEYLARENIEPFLVFRNEPQSGWYPVEIRVFPTVLV